LNRVFKQRDRVVIEKSGIPVAVLVSTEDYRRLQRADEETARRFALLEEFRKPFEGIPAEEIEREVEKALAEVRAEMRAERAAKTHAE
jgi:prevent-host-death family protein